MGAGLSTDARAHHAAKTACASVEEGLNGTEADLAMVFLSHAHVEHASEIIDVVRTDLRAGCLIGVSASGVLGGAIEIEGSPGVSVIGMRLPGVQITPFASEQFMPVDDSDDGIDRLGATLGVPDGPGPLRGVFMFADPYTTPMIKLLPAMNRALSRGQGYSPSFPRTPIIGGLASAGTAAGGNVLMLDGRPIRSGAVGVSLRGAVRVDTIVSQGCRPFGPTFVVTKARGNFIFQLGGRPALHAVQDAIESLDDERKPLLEQGLYVGRAISEYKDRFGRNDFLIRNVMGADPNSGAIAVSDMIRIGQTIQLHVRDSVTAHEDLAMLLDAQKLHDRPHGALLITCNGRGSKLFQQPHHDASSLVRAFQAPLAGETKSKAGMQIDAHPGPVPIAGFFASGEIGPLGTDSFLHSQTACAAVFRTPGI
jgi:small ligand-binding sensory domain FIST